MKTKKSPLGIGPKKKFKKKIQGKKIKLKGKFKKKFIFFLKKIQGKIQDSRIKFKDKLKKVKQESSLEVSLGKIKKKEFKKNILEFFLEEKLKEFNHEKAHCQFLSVKNVQKSP